MNIIASNIPFYNWIGTKRFFDVFFGLHNAFEKDFILQLELIKIMNVLKEINFVKFTIKSKL